MTRLAFCARAAMVAACAVFLSCADSGNGSSQCGDGIDNDDDGLIDEADPACAAGNSTESDDPAPLCADGVDNDADGLTDYPEDPGCSSATDPDEYTGAAPGCMNGRDDDGDGKFDYPNDPGCLIANQEDETDDCPDGPNCPECGNDVDDDLDGLTDYPDDPGCTAASTSFEYNLDPAACGTGTLVAALPTSGTATGTLGTAASNVQEASCTGTVGAGAEAVYSFLIEEPSTLVATTNSAATTVDTVLYVRGLCRSPETEQGCNDDVASGNTKSSLTVDLEPGAYFLIVDAKTVGATGMYSLQATIYPGPGQDCSGPGQCAPGYECRIPFGGSGTSCELPACSDGRDDDGDDKTDYPFDPGCTAPTDTSESDQCGTPGASCPHCSDGLDNDGDDHTDWPDDTACESAGGATEYACVSTDPIRTFESDLTAQATAALANDIDLSCGTNGRDEVFLLNLDRDLAELRVDTVGSTSNTALGLKRANCASTDLVCDDDGAGDQDARLIVSDLAEGDYYLIIDDANTAGTYNLHVRGVVDDGENCVLDSALYGCADGYACTGSGATATCTLAACNDGDDDGDSDGLFGYPTDPGCESPSDTTEVDDCPGGPLCPQCANGSDDDGDGLRDYPLDPGCSAASDSDERTPCTSTDSVVVITGPTITGATTGAVTGGHPARANDFDLSCGSDGRDEVYYLQVNTPLTNLTIDTVGSALDTVLAVRSGSCGGVELECDDDGAGNLDSRVVLDNVSRGEYFIIVDDRTNSDATYNLHVTATIAVGGACDPLSTVILCPNGYACQGTTPTCQLAACNNGGDNDGDTKIDYPNDPGCDSVSDNDESDACPSGPGCPQCADGMDNDGDNYADFAGIPAGPGGTPPAMPADPSCTAASGALEIAPCTSTDTVAELTGNLPLGTFVGRTNDADLSCGSDGRDMIFRYNVRSPLVSLSVDTGGSDTNTAVAIRRDNCNTATDLACATANFGNGDARATATNVTAGEYFFIVDDLNTATPSTFSLNISGVIPAEGRCSPGSTAFVCDVGTACAGTSGAEVCVRGVCNDGDDDGDNDGLFGYPTDPGCDSISDTSEDDVCATNPNDPACPDCADHVDNDGDGAIDYPADTGCTSASSNLEVGCPLETDPVGTITAATTTGTTTGAAHNFTPSCSTTSTAPDRVYMLTLPVAVASLTINTTGSAYDTVLSLMSSTCGMSLACNDDDTLGLQSSITQTGVAAGTYAIVVDGFTSSSGNYNLSVRGSVAAGTACTHPLFAAGVLTCPAACSAGVCQ